MLLYKEATEDLVGKPTQLINLIQWILVLGPPAPSPSTPQTHRSHQKPPGPAPLSACLKTRLRNN